jgi:hypothetical protein
MAFLSVLAALFRQPFRWSPHSWPIFRPVDSTFQTDFLTRDFGWQDGSTAACAAQERELLNGDFDVEAAGLLYGHSAADGEGRADQDAELAAAQEATELNGDAGHSPDRAG